MLKSSSDHIKTYYNATSAERQVHRPALTEDTAADVCNVGAGFFGMYCALEMARSGKKVVAVEASRVGWGASGRNGGQLVPGWACGMDALKYLLALARLVQAQGVRIHEQSRVSG